jgi:nucleotidyltransferase substrate binding protein (TIGR01987 family)
MSNQDIRWKQRAEQFGKAFGLLQSAINLEKLSIIERAGLIQFFEMAFELSWKLLKDYQEAEGYTINSPRDAIKQAFQSGLISKGHDWIDALDDRNLTTHIYNEQIAIAVEQKIRQVYYPLLQSLHSLFAEKLG